MQPSGKLFRKVALDRLSSPEQIDRLARVTTPRAWIALVGLGTLVIMAIVWGIVTTVPISQPAQGLLLRGEGIQLVYAPRAAQVTRLFVGPGDTVNPNQTVATLTDVETNQTYNVTSSQPGHILEMRVSQGDVVSAGEALLSMEPMSGDLEAVLYVPSSVSKALKPGLEVQISPVNVRREAYGFILGKVKSIGAFPATQQGMLRVLGSDDLVKQFSQNGAPVEVRIQLEKSDTSSGFKWSFPQGPPFAIETGTFCTASIIIGEQRPISMILGIPQ